METKKTSQSIVGQRFDAYVALLSEALDHPSRVEPMRDYCTGLLLPLERKSIEPIAARVAPENTAAKHQSLQQFIADSPWRDAAVMGVVRRYAMPALLARGPIEATLIDDSGLPKQGKASVGVARQYCGQVGKVANCQVAVSISVANRWASLPIAYDLYLPAQWAQDQARRDKAGVPAEVVFRTKPQIALDQLRAAVRAGIELGVVNADAAYGDETTFRDQLTALGLLYCVSIREATTVWPEGQMPLAPKPDSGRGAPATRLRRDEEHSPVSVKELALSLPKKCFRKVSWREGARGKLSSRFAAVQVRAAHQDYLLSEARPEQWLLIEWPLGKDAPTKYWLSTLPPQISLKKLVYFAKLRWRIEHDYEELKQEIGLGHYEGRKWRGFHHHATMCIAAYAFLVAERGLFPPADLTHEPRLPELEIPDRRGSQVSSRASRTTQSNLNRHHPQTSHRRVGAPRLSLPVLPSPESQQQACDN